MEIKVGDRFRPLPNSPRYGPKRWKQDSEGVWVEQEITALDRFEDDLAWTDNPTVDRSTPITEADAEADPALRDYVGGFAVFPKTAPYIPGDSPEAKAERQKIESEWEKRSLAMHENQKPLPELAEKPSEIVPKYHEITTQRGD